MEFHDWASFRAAAGRERSTWIGAGCVILAAIAASLLFNQAQLIDYAGRWVIIGPAVVAALGFLGIVKKAPPCGGSPAEPPQ